MTFCVNTGWSLGEHQEWAKYSNFEVVTRVPLILYVPKVTHFPDSISPTFPYVDVLDSIKTMPNFTNRNTAGSTSDALVELVDLFPTLVDLAGLTAIPTCPLHSNKVDLCTEGHSFAALLTELRQSNQRVRNWHKKAAFSQYPRPAFYPQADSYYTRLRDIKIMGYSMRTENYRYTEWVSFNRTSFSGDWNHIYARELYLSDTDPNEDINRAYEHGYQELVQNASHLLHLGWSSSLL